MKITINNTELQLKNSFRNYVIYERITGSTFSNVDKLEDILNLFYSCILAAAQREGITISVNDFYDYIDDNPQSIHEFVVWLQSELTISNMLNPQSDTNPKPKTTKKKN